MPSFLTHLIAWQMVHSCFLEQRKDIWTLSNELISFDSLYEIPGVQEGQPDILQHIWQERKPFRLLVTDPVHYSFEHLCFFRDVEIITLQRAAENVGRQLQELLVVQDLCEVLDNVILHLLFQAVQGVGISQPQNANAVLRLEGFSEKTGTSIYHAKELWTEKTCISTEQLLVWLYRMRAMELWGWVPTSHMQYSKELGGTRNQSYKDMYLPESPVSNENVFLPLLFLPLHPYCSSSLLQNTEDLWQSWILFVSQK